jgi:hypothetical protein
MRFQAQRAGGRRRKLSMWTSVWTRTGSWQMGSVKIIDSNGRGGAI